MAPIHHFSTWQLAVPEGWHTPEWAQELLWHPTGAAACSRAEILELNITNPRYSQADPFAQGQITCFWRKTKIYAPLPNFYPYAVVGTSSVASCWTGTRKAGRLMVSQTESLAPRRVQAAAGCGAVQGHQPLVSHVASLLPTLCILVTSNAKWQQSCGQSLAPSVMELSQPGNTQSSSHPQPQTCRNRNSMLFLSGTTAKRKTTLCHMERWVIKHEGKKNYFIAKQ